MYLNLLSHNGKQLTGSRNKVMVQFKCHKWFWQCPGITQSKINVTHMIVC